MYACLCTHKPDCYHSCFLITYFCTQKIIGSDRNEDLSAIDKKLFIETYGAYLQIQTCLSFASFVKDMAVIYDILRIARDDPSHRDAVKDIQKPGDSFYDSVSKVFSYSY